jgi:hypothetical protein
MDHFLTHIYQAERKLATESGVDKSRRDQQTPTTIRRTGPDGGSDVGRELYPFKGMGEGTDTRFQLGIFSNPQVIGSGLLTLTPVGRDDKISVQALISQPSLNFL